MATGRATKSLVSRRRRAGSDSQDEDAVAMVEDSQSEGDATSTHEEDADADGSENSDDESDAVNRDAVSTSNGAKTKATTSAVDQENTAELEVSTNVASQAADGAFSTNADTKTMMNGLTASRDAEQAVVVDFEEMGTDPVKADQNVSERRPSKAKGETIAERRRREHDEYKQRRDSDPTFIPNRGNFFMHDARAPDQRGFTPYGRGRGRGRGFVGGPFAPAGSMSQPDKTADAPWAHDLHQTLYEDPPNAPTQRSQRANTAAPPASTRSETKVPPAAVSRPYNFSTSKLLGNVQVRICLPSMKPTAPTASVPVKQHTRLPDHRPPLRRDKPIRVSLPERQARYIFPSQERSFIFIPRALRPNQQGWAKSRGSQGYAGSSSRRTSVYGGSGYSPSIAPSRRSSLARDIPQEMVLPPAGSIAPRAAPQAARPVVRMPQAPQTHSTVAAAEMIEAYPRPQGYPLPQTPAIEHYRETTTMHQPRPQKTIHVSGIDSPANLSLHAPQQKDQQPFENQLPHHMADTSGSSQATGGDAMHPRFYSYRGNSSTGTPLSNIPERAIHAQPFQPPMQQYAPAMYGGFAQGGYPQGGYYYPQAGPQYEQTPLYAGPRTFSAPDAQAASGSAGNPPGQGQSTGTGPVAHESNGMVYYIDPNQVPQYLPQEQYHGQESYLQTQSYAVPGMGGMMTPSPEGGFYYPAVPSGPMFYPQT